MASGSEFLLDIQARMRGNATSELSKAAQAASDAVARYKELEASSVATSKALERVGAASESLRARMSKAMEAGDGEKFWKLAGQLQKVTERENQLKAKALETKAALESQAKAVTGLADEVGRLKSQGQAEPLDVEKTAGGIKKLGGPLGSIGDKVEEFSESWGALKGNLGTTGAVAAVAAVAIVAVAAAIAAAIVKTAAWAVGLADTRRNLSLTLEAMAGGASEGKALGDAFHEITSATGVTSDRLMDVTRDLQKAGVSAQDLPRALRAIAMQESALSDTSGTSDLIASLKDGKTTAEELAQTMDSKFGSVVEKKMQGLGAQSEQLQRNFSDIFGGLNIEPLLEGFSKLVALFDVNTASGQALKTLFESLFQPIVNGAGNAATKVERFILGAEIGALKVAIAVKKLAKEFGFDLGGLDALPDAGAVGEAVLYSVAAVAGVVAAAIGVIAVATQGTIAAWQTLASVGSAVWTAVSSAASSFASFFTGIPAKVSTVGSSIIDGLVAGIKAGADKVITAITGVADGAVTAAKEKLGIKSPSRVFAEIGGYTAEGFAIGIDDGAEAANDSMARLVEPPEAKQAARAGAKVGGTNVTVNIYGVTGAEDMLQQLEAKLREVIDGVAESVGAADEGMVAA